MKRTCFTGMALVASALALSGCERNQRVVGVWYGNGNRLEFRQDGSMTIESGAGKESGTWDAGSPYVTMRLEGKTVTCEVASYLKRQLGLTNSGPQSCPYKGLYWRTDMPEAERKDGIQSYQCNMQVRHVGHLDYPAQYVINIDTKDQIACYGSAAGKCNIVSSARNVSDRGFKLFVTWQDGGGEEYEIKKADTSNAFDMTIAVADSCNGTSCTFGSYHRAGTCSRLP